MLGVPKNWHAEQVGILKISIEFLNKQVLPPFMTLLDLKSIINGDV